MVDVGYTWKFTDSFDLDIDDDGVIQTVDDTDKLEQDYTYLLHIMKKEDIFNPEFGTDLIALTNARTSKAVTDVIKESLRQYKYTDSILFVRLDSRDTTNRTMRISARVKVIGEPGFITTQVVI